MMRDRRQNGSGQHTWKRRQDYRWTMERLEDVGRDGKKEKEGDRKIRKREIRPSKWEKETLKQSCDTGLLAKTSSHIRRMQYKWDNMAGHGQASPTLTVTETRGCSVLVL